MTLSAQHRVEHALNTTFPRIRDGWVRRKWSCANGDGTAMRYGWWASTDGMGWHYLGCTAAEAIAYVTTDPRFAAWLRGSPAAPSGPQ